MWYARVSGGCADFILALLVISVFSFPSVCRSVSPASQRFPLQPPRSGDGPVSGMQASRGLHQSHAVARLPPSVAMQREMGRTAVQLTVFSLVIKQPTTEKVARDQTTTQQHVVRTGQAKVGAAPTRWPLDGSLCSAHATSTTQKRQKQTYPEHPKRTRTHKDTSTIKQTCNPKRTDKGRKTLSRRQWPPTPHRGRQTSGPSKYQQPWRHAARPAWTQGQPLALAQVPRRRDKKRKKKKSTRGRHAPRATDGAVPLAHTPTQKGNPKTIKAAASHPRLGHRRQPRQLLHHPQLDGVDAKGPRGKQLAGAPPLGQQHKRR